MYKHTLIRYTRVASGVCISKPCYPLYASEAKRSYDKLFTQMKAPPVLSQRKGKRIRNQPRIPLRQKELYHYSYLHGQVKGEKEKNYS